MPCDNEKQEADDAADRLNEAMDRAAEYNNDVLESGADMLDADHDFWESLGSDDPDAVADAYDAYGFAEEKFLNDWDAAVAASEAANDAYGDWKDKYDDYCDCLASNTGP